MFPPCSCVWLWLAMQSHSALCNCVAHAVPRTAQSPNVFLPRRLNDRSLAQFCIVTAASIALLHARFLNAQCEGLGFAHIHPRPPIARMNLLR